MGGVCDWPCAVDAAGGAPQPPRRAVPSSDGKRCRFVGRAVSDRTYPTAEVPELAWTNGSFGGPAMRQNSLPALTWRVSTTASLSVLIVCEQPAGSLSRP